MAETIEKHESYTETADGAVAIVDVAELRDAQRDERVQGLHRDADAQLAEDEAAGRVHY